MGLTGFAALLKSLADLGASPAVQAALLKWFADLTGVSQAVLELALKTAEHAEEPK